MKTASLIKFAAIALTVGATATANAGGLLGGGGLIGGGALGGNIGGNLGGSFNGMGALNRPIITEGAGRTAVGSLRESAGSQIDASRTYGRATAANARATGSTVKDLAGSVQGPDVAGAAQGVNLGGSITGSGNASGNGSASGNAAKTEKAAKD
jgi:hypothetical protein